MYSEWRFGAVYSYDYTVSASPKLQLFRKRYAIMVIIYEYGIVMRYVSGTTTDIILYYCVVV